MALMSSYAPKSNMWGSQYGGTGNELYNKYSGSTSSLMGALDSGKLSSGDTFLAGRPAGAGSSQPDWNNMSWNELFAYAAKQKKKQYEDYKRTIGV